MIDLYKQLFSAIRRNKIGFFFFLLPYCMLLIRRFVPDVSILTSALNISATGLLAIGALITFLKTNPRNRFFIILAATVSLGVFLAARNASLIKWSLIIIAFPNTNLRTAIGADFALRTLLYFTLISLSLIGVVDNVSVGRGDIVRYSLGFYHPNTLAIQTVILFVELLYLRFIKSKLLLGIIFATASAIILFVANGRASFLFLCLFTALFIAMHYWRQKPHPILHKILNFLPYVYPITFVIAFLALWLFTAQTSLGELLNSLLSKRLSLTDYWLNELGVHPFGVILSEQDITVDMLPFYALIAFGVVPTCLSLILMPCTIKALMKKQLYLEASILTIFVLFSLSEKTVLWPIINPFMLLYIAAFLDSHSKVLAPIHPAKKRQKVLRG